MNFYSDYHEERNEFQREPFDIFWETNSHGLLSIKDCNRPMRPLYRRGASPLPMNRRQRKISFLNSCLVGAGIGFFLFVIFISGWYLYRHMGFIEKPNSTSPPILMSVDSLFKVPDDKPAHNPQNRIVGYYKAWDSQVITEYQMSKLTHVIFKYLVMNSNQTLAFKNNLEEMKFFDLMKRRSQSPELKIMVSIEITGGRKKEEDFNTVIKSIVSFILNHQLDGVDIDWRYPTPVDIPRQVDFVKSLREAFPNPQSYIISMTASGLEWKYKYRIKLKELLVHVDFFNVLSFDYYTSSITGPPAPLFSGVGEYRGYNVDRTMKYFACETGAPGKLNMGVPFYGTLWRNVGASPIDNLDEMWRVANGTSHIPWRLLKKGILKASWNKNAMTPYVWNAKHKTLLGFENQKSLEKKMVYAKKKNLGGIVIESIGGDDNENSLLAVIAEQRFIVERNDVNFKC
ncbi:hypothetical protein CRE_12993 [Caenorhabditis remanei]|uniref:GH18 domain-containing protein n=1 Tax=Caenorhabditis remanei TaxID=31234 RepID=E3N155_CAERE|nr:hypothetical protein CRE_12993 [Caenorhabditis remanei]